MPTSNGSKSLDRDWLFNSLVRVPVETTNFSNSFFSLHFAIARRTSSWDSVKGFYLKIPVVFLKQLILVMSYEVQHTFQGPGIETFILEHGDSSGE